MENILYKQRHSWKKTALLACSRREAHSTEKKKKSKSFWVTKCGAEEHRRESEAHGGCALAWMNVRQTQRMQTVLKGCWAWMWHSKIRSAKHGHGAAAAWGGAGKLLHVLQGWICCWHGRGDVWGQEWDSSAAGNVKLLLLAAPRASGCLKQMWKQFQAACWKQSCGARAPLLIRFNMSFFCTSPGFLCFSQSWFHHLQESLCREKGF